MRTKILYVLVSTEEDIFAEQTYLSILSLKKHNIDVKVSLIMDNKTELSLKKRKFDLLNLIDESIVVPLSDDMTNKYKSRVLKTSMRNYLDGDVLYIDSDTIILSDLSEIDNISYDIAAVNEFNRPFSDSSSKNTLREIFKRLGEDLNSIKDYFNSGVLLIKDNPKTRLFFSEWNRQWEEGTRKGVFFDQPSLGLINLRNGNVISQLDGSWNCQGRYSVNFSKSAKIFHYLYDQGFVFPLLEKNFFNDLKHQGLVGDELQNILENPYGYISTNNLIITDDDVILFNSKLYSLIRSIYKHKRLYRFIETLISKAYAFFVSLMVRNLAPPR